MRSRASRVFLSAALFCLGPVAAIASGAKGSFGLAAMAHTPNWPSNTEVLPWDGTSEGEFVYRAIPCSGNAPMNNISSNLPTYNSLIRDSRSPASTRAQPFRFKVENGAMTGSINLTVCKLGPGPTNDGKDDAKRDHIAIDFTARADRRTGEETIFSGTFTISGGTAATRNSPAPARSVATSCASTRRAALRAIGGGSGTCNSYLTGHSAMQPSRNDGHPVRADWVTPRAVALAAVFFVALGGSTLACGQMSPVDPAKPGTTVIIRGYGYGYQGGERPVFLVWAATGVVAARASIGGNGEFTAEILAPLAPGQHDLIVREGETDPAPATVTVPVVPVQSAALAPKIRP